MEDLVTVAKIVKPRGLRGETVADVITDFPERFDELTTVVAVLPNGEQRDLTIENFWFQKKRIVFKFAEIAAIEQAEPLRDAEICVPERDAVTLDADEFFDWQLRDCAVETIAGDRLGTVKEIMRTGGTEVLVVQTEAEEAKEYLIPFARSICTTVDVENKLIRVDAPEGLLDF